jgi:hypothetical protein
MDAGTDWVSSQGKYAVVLDGTNDYIVASRTAQIAAVSMWVLVNSTAGNRRLISINTNAFSMYCGPSTLRVNTVYNNSDAMTDMFLNASAWNHVCMSFDGANLKCFLNGVEKNSRAVSVANLSTAPIYFGSLDTSFNIQYWNGNMDDMMVFNGPVSARQAALLASRRGIAYELAPRRRSSAQVVASFNRRRRLLIGAGS